MRSQQEDYDNFSFNFMEHGLECSTVTVEVICTSLSFLPSTRGALDKGGFADDDKVFFMGVVRKYGVSIIHLDVGTIVFGSVEIKEITSQHVLDNKPVIVNVHITSIVKIPDILIQKFDNSTPLLAASMSALVAGLTCVSQCLKPQNGETIIICTNSVKYVWPIIYWITTLDITVYLYLQESELKKFSVEQNTASSMISALLKNERRNKNSCLCCSITIRPLNASFVDEIFANTNCIGVNSILVYPNVEVTLDSDITFFRRLLTVISPLGRIVYCEPVLVDTIDCKALYAKSISMIYFNFQAIMQSEAHHGSLLYIIQRVITSLLEDRSWKLDPEMLFKFPISQFEAALEAVQDKAGSVVVCNSL